MHDERTFALFCNIHFSDICRVYNDFFLHHTRNQCHIIYRPNESNSTNFLWKQCCQLRWLSKFQTYLTDRKKAFFEALKLKVCLVVFHMTWQQRYMLKAHQKRRQTNSFPPTLHSWLFILSLIPTLCRMRACQQVNEVYRSTPRRSRSQICCCCLE